MSNTTVPALPNPMTPLAFLPPDIARQIQNSIYVVVGALGAMFWDILTNAAGDYDLLFKYKIRIPTLVYFASRICSLAYILGSAIVETAPIGNCARNGTYITPWFPLSSGLTALLFFFRIQAIFSQNKIVVGFFFVLWLSVVGGTATIPPAVTVAHIGPTPYCMHASIESFSGAAAVLPFVHDTLVFLAISWRLMQNAHINHSEEGTGSFLKSFLLGKHLPMFSKALLQDGQMYYLMTVGTNLLALIFFFHRSLPAPYQSVMSVPNIMITNSMACQVFRRARRGVIQETTLSTTAASSSRSGGGIIPLSNVRRPPRPNESGTLVITKTVDEHQSTDPVDVEFPASKKHYNAYE